MDYQLIAFDMDGTLLDSSKGILPSTLDAIREAAARDKVVAIATGRYSLAHSREDTALTAMHAGMTAREMYVPLIVAKT